MDLHPDQIRSIVEQVTRDLEQKMPGVDAVVAGADRAVEHAEGLRRAALEGLPALPDPEKRANEGPRAPRGVHANLEQAVRAAEQAHRTLVQWPVTLRDRDSLEQIRIPIAQVADELEGRLKSVWTTPKLATPA